MSDNVTLVLSALVVLGVPGWTVWSTWQIARRTPTRRLALSYVLSSLAGTALVGVILPAVLKGVLDPFPIWVGYAALCVAAAAVLGWRWSALERGSGRRLSLVITTVLLLAVLAAAGVAVT